MVTPRERSRVCVANSHFQAYRRQICIVAWELGLRNFNGNLRVCGRLEHDAYNNLGDPSVYIL